ncbi:1,4-beta-xylanase [Luteolibacter ambystomatis]|uniref:1,4-beta-xylanase n=1 Tax=Luteolibacter ambystomatis TaxID=2824561 RepID=A0A975PH01_9BACT|nr:1,4-beta-xylanase [Luteolibacter ambystomatis]QUE52781.1 1,4-beta-xylanase [Luteolibacter ambystomatis]
MLKTFVHLLIAGALGTATLHAQDAQPWTPEKAKAWQEKSGWLNGCNFIPSNAINQLEMWQADTFDTATIDRELGLAESLGFTSVRVFLHDLLWQQDSKGFSKRIDTFLGLAEKHHIGVLFVLFDSCWYPKPKLGKQPDPLPHRHNSGWVQSPGIDALMDENQIPRLHEYVTGVVKQFANDPRIHGWDVWNEPDNNDGGKSKRPDLEPDQKIKSQHVEKLLPQVFAWAREGKPTQPLTSGVWLGDWSDPNKMYLIQRIQLEQSDVISFHCYGKPDHLTKLIGQLRRYNRPILCTEYMARPEGSTFDPNLGVLKKEGVGAYCWGFVSGKSQTIYPWDSWEKDYDGEPQLWFHDIFRTDGTPYRQPEVDYIRSLTGKK